MNYSDKGSLFVDCDCDPSKSLLQVLAQRFTRSSPARTCDQDYVSPSKVHLDAGEDDRTSHVHVPAVSVQSYAPSTCIYDCTGHAAAACTGLEIRCVMSLWSLDVVLATSWLGWIAASG